VRMRIDKTSIHYLPTRDQPFKPTNDDFSDLQHLNRPGAQRFATWLAGEIAAQLTEK